MEEPKQTPTTKVDDAQEPPPRLPPLGSAGHGQLAPAHLSPFALETNVSRIATAISLGRPATFD